MKILKTYNQLFENFDKISVDNLMINFSDWDYIEKWLKKGGDINVKDRDGWTLLTLNTNNNNFFIVTDLLELGADPNIPNGNGNTALILARDIDMIKFLIDNDADWNMINNNGKDFVDLLNNDEKEIIKKEYPEKYQEYLKKKQMIKFNI